MTTEIQTTKEPGQRNWASALSKIPEPFRSALAEGLRQDLVLNPGEMKRLRPELSDLEQNMLKGGRALSLITHAAYIPFHLLRLDEEDAACESLRTGMAKELLSTLNERLSKTQTVLLIGDDPSPESVAKAIDRCKKENDIAEL